MKLKRKHVLLDFLVIFVFTLILESFCFAVENPPLPNLGKPIILTSCGQSPDYGIPSLLGKRIGLEMAMDPLVLPEKIVVFKTLIIVIGGSGKGLGAAGVDIPDEVRRVKEVIRKAREEEIYILGMHLGGKARRGPNSDHFIPFAADVDYLIVREEGNMDGYFTKVAKENNIPLFLIEKNPELTEKMFEKSFDIFLNTSPKIKITDDISIIDCTE